MCVFQSMKSLSNGISRSDINRDSTSVVSDYTLPTSYTDVPHILNKCTQFSCPLPTINIPDSICDDLMLNSNRIEENKWMDNVLSSDPNVRKSWSSYHARKHHVSILPPCNRFILPLLKDVVHTFDMHHHLTSL